MVIAIRKEPNGSIYTDKNLRAEINYVELGFTLINIDDIYADCEDADFNEDFTFSVEKYNARKFEEDNDARKFQIQQRLTKLSQDFIQAMAGAYFEDLEARKAEFQTLHNELRILEGKEPREYNFNNNSIE